MTITRADVVAAARSWLGVPWLHQGRSRSGVDCAGLVICVARELGLTTFDTHAYPRTPTGELLGICSANMTSIAIGRMAPADVVVLRFAGLPLESHLAFVTDYRIAPGNVALLHCLNRGGQRGASSCVMEHRMDQTWRARIVAAYRLPGVD